MGFAPTDAVARPGRGCVNEQEKQRRLLTYAKRIAPSAETIESLATESSAPLEPGAEALEHAIKATHAVTRGLESTLRPEELWALEAIVLPRNRPVIDIINGSYLRPGSPWSALDDANFRKPIEAAIPAIGRVEISEHPTLPYVGTGFVVGRGLLMTNRHVAEMFTLGLGMRGLRFQPGLDNVQVDFKRERGSSASSPFRVRRVLMIHPYWDMALMEVEGVDGLRPLTLDSRHVDEVREQDVVVIGYPAQDPRNDAALQHRIFRGVYQVKRLQPGKIMGAQRTSSFGRMVEALAHDSSTLGGNSGSAILDARSGKVLGLHFGGRYLEANYAVSAHDLSRDSRVVDAGVLFTKTNVGGQLPWANAWKDNEGPPAVPPSPPPPSPVLFVPAPSGESLALTIPLHITLRLGVPALAGNGQTALVTGPAVPPPVPGQPWGGVGAGAPGLTQVDVAAAVAEAQRTRDLPYYDAEADALDRERYYAGVQPDSDQDAFYDGLHGLLERTHTDRPSYNPSRLLYPWVDRQKDLLLRSLYSAAGHSFTLQEILQKDLEVERERALRLLERPLTESLDQGFLEQLESALPYNCEHVVPQSWFKAREPMRGDLHHLFVCEMRCNSFRGNNAYFEFPSTEAFQQDCGRAERNRFEPGAGKGAAARATLYFLVRYPNAINSPAELAEERLETLLRWHQQERPSEWELHRNQAIFSIQKNRNPFIDFPEWAARVRFARGLGR